MQTDAVSAPEKVVENRYLAPIPGKKRGILPAEAVESRPDFQCPAGLLRRISHSLSESPLAEWQQGCDPNDSD